MIEPFQRVIDGEKGVYVVCSDKALLDKINKMLKRQGIVGITDAEGKLHYMVDARKSPGHAARQVNDFVNSVRDRSLNGVVGEIDVDIADMILCETIESVLQFYGIDRSLSGSKIISFILRYIMYNSKVERTNLKELYSISEWEFQMSYSQIERNVRYALHKSKFAEVKLKTMQIVGILVDAVKMGLTDKNLTFRDVSSLEEQYEITE